MAGPLPNPDVVAGARIVVEANPARPTPETTPRPPSGESADAATGTAAVAGMAAAARVDGNSARTMFEILAAGRDMQRVIQEKVAALKKDSATPAELALALDLEMGGIELEVFKIRNLQQEKGKIPRDLEEKRDKLIKRYENLQKERVSGKITLPDLPGGRVIDKPLPQVSELANVALGLGATAESAKTPLPALEKLVTEAIVSPAARKELVGNLRREVGKGTIPLTEDQINAFETYLNESAKRLSREKNVKLLAKGAGLTGLLMLIMFYVSSKSESQGQH